MADLGDTIDCFSVVRQLYTHRTQAGVSFKMVTLADGAIAIFKEDRCIYLSDTSLDGMDKTLAEWNRIAQTK